MILCEWGTTQDFAQALEGTHVTQLVPKLFQHLKNTPKTETTLDLSKNHLSLIPVENMAQILDSLGGPLYHVNTLLLDLDDTQAMLPKQRQALLAFCPNLKKALFIQNSQPLGDTVLDQANLAIRFGFPFKVPSLESMCGFFVRSQGIDTTSLSKGLQEFVQLTHS